MFAVRLLIPEPKQFRTQRNYDLDEESVAKNNVVIAFIKELVGARKAKVNREDKVCNSTVK